MDLNPEQIAAAGKFWEIFQVSIKSFVPHPGRYASHDMIGFVDLHITIREPDESAAPDVNAVRTYLAGTMDLYLNGCKAKLLSGGPYLEMKKEKGKSKVKEDGSAEEKDPWYSIFAPGNKVTRAVLHTVVFSNIDVRSTIEQVLQLPKPAAKQQTQGGQQGANPFTDKQ